MSTMDTTARHVIFLGAGASNGSGYPLANDLRLLMSSRDTWENALIKYQSERSPSGGAFVRQGLDFWDSHRDAIELFRNGGFATLDEFCKLASGFPFQDEINGLRRVVRAALGLFNPEDHFEKSEYYSFVQSLFKDDLRSLREDVTVLTYNYDPYLEFLLYRALEHRYKVTRKGRSPVIQEHELPGIKMHGQVLNSVTSGLHDLRDQNWFGDESSPQYFSVLKLHGSISYVADPTAGFDILFAPDVHARAKILFEGTYSYVAPPVLFPWEIMTADGFVDQKSFPAPNLYGLFRGIWERARRQVLAADRISFVGLSMHPFLTDGLAYLFKGKQGTTEVILANRDNPVFVPGRTETHWEKHPYCTAYALRELLSKVAPKMTRVGIVQGHLGYSPGDFTLVPDFKTFIRTQLKPGLGPPPAPR